MATPVGMRELLEKVTLVPHLPDLKPTFSAGLTAYDELEPLDVCIERADRALYAAKAAGRTPPSHPEGYLEAFAGLASWPCLRTISMAISSDCS